MKKLLTGITTMGLALALSGTMAVTAHPSCGHHSNQSKNCRTSAVCCYVDADGDGRCDDCGIKLKKHCDPCSTGSGRHSRRCR